MLSVKQGGIKYQFWVFGMTQPGDWTQVSWAIGEHSNHYANVRNTNTELMEWKTNKFILYIHKIHISSLKRKHKYVWPDKTMHILFYEQTVCEKGTKMEELLLDDGQ